MSLSPETVVVRTRALSVAEVESELVMMDLARGKYYGLNPVATAIWQMLEEPVAVGTLCERLRARFDVDAETCEAEVTAFLEQLIAADLLAERDGPGEDGR